MILDTFSRTYPGVELILMERQMTVLHEMIKRGEAFLYFRRDPASMPAVRLLLSDKGISYEEKSVLLLQKKQIFNRGRGLFNSVSAGNTE